MGKRFTQAQVDLALRKEQLIQRVEQGESLKAVSQDLGLTYHPKHVSRLRRRYIEGGRHWVALVDGREGGRATKITRKVALWIMGELQRDPNVTASHLCDEVRNRFGVEVSEGRMRQLAIALGRQGQPGRPRRASPPGVTSAEPLIIEQTLHAGIFFPTGGAMADGDSACHDPCVAEVQRTVSAARREARVADLDQSTRNGREQIANAHLVAVSILGTVLQLDRLPGSWFGGRGAEWYSLQVWRIGIVLE
jgi:transposase